MTPKAAYERIICDLGEGVRRMPADREIREGIDILETNAYYNPYVN